MWFPLREMSKTPTVIAESYQSPAVPSGHTCAFERGV